MIEDNKILKPLTNADVWSLLGTLHTANDMCESDDINMFSLNKPMPNSNIFHSTENWQRGTNMNYGIVVADQYGIDNSATIGTDGKPVVSNWTREKPTSRFHLNDFIGYNHMALSPVIRSEVSYAADLYSETSVRANFTLDSSEIKCSDVLCTLTAVSGEVLAQPHISELALGCELYRLEEVVDASTGDTTYTKVSIRTIQNTATIVNQSYIDISLTGCEAGTYYLRFFLVYPEHTTHWYPIYFNSAKANPATLTITNTTPVISISVVELYKHMEVFGLESQTETSYNCSGTLGVTLTNNGAQAFSAADNLYAVVTWSGLTQTCNVLGTITADGTKTENNSVQVASGASVNVYFDISMTLTAESGQVVSYDETANYTIYRSGSTTALLTGTITRSQIS